MALRVLRARLVAIAVVTGFGVAAASATAAPVTVYSSKQTTALGKILVSGSGRTLYHYSPEKKNVVKCTAACAAKWPPLLIGSGVKPIAGPGATASLLGTVKRPDGKLQVTYRGLALYLFSGDKKAGDVKGHGKRPDLVCARGAVRRGCDEGCDYFDDHPESDHPEELRRRLRLGDGNRLGNRLRQHGDVGGLRRQPRRRRLRHVVKEARTSSSAGPATRRQNSTSGR